MNAAALAELAYMLVPLMERAENSRGAALLSLAALDCEAASLAPEAPELRAALLDDARRLARDGALVGIASGGALAVALREALRGGVGRRGAARA